MKFIRHLSVILFVFSLILIEISLDGFILSTVEGETTEWETVNAVTVSTVTVELPPLTNDEEIQSVSTQTYTVELPPLTNDEETQSVPTHSDIETISENNDASSSNNHDIAVTSSYTTIVPAIYVSPDDSEYESVIASSSTVSANNNTVETEHIWGNRTVLKNADCSNPTQVQYSCTVCGTMKVEEEGSPDPSAHQWSEWAINTSATCSTTGVRHRQCLLSVHHTESQIIPALGHDPTWKVTQEATVSSDGRRSQVCSRCGETLATETIPRLSGGGSVTSAPQMSQATTPPVPTSVPSQSQSNTRCTHSWNNRTMTRPANCSVPAQFQYICDWCGMVRTQEEGSLDSTAHTWGNWNTLSEATCTATGTQERFCINNANHRETQAIPALGHHTSWKVTREATSTQTGLREKICTRCETVFETEEIPKTAANSSPSTGTPTTAPTVSPNKATSTVTGKAKGTSNNQASAGNSTLISSMPKAFFSLYNTNTSDKYSPDTVYNYQIIEGDLSLGTDIRTIMNNKKFRVLAFGLNEEPDFNDDFQVDRRAGELIIHEDQLSERWYQDHVNGHGIVLQTSELIHYDYVRLAIGLFDQENSEEPSSWANYAFKILGGMKTTPVTITFQQENLTLLSGERSAVPYALSPNNTEKTEAIWSSSDDSIVSVNNSGEVSALSPGTVTISAAIPDGNTEKCIVTVIGKQIEKITLNKTSENIFVGDKLKLTAQVEPYGADDRNMIWFSSNPAVAEVDTDGTILAVGPGAAVIMAAASDESDVKSYCLVMVLQKNR